MLILDQFKKQKLTYGEALNPAMDVETPEEANAYFDAYVSWMVSGGQPRERAEAVARVNIGYFTGYCSQETMARVHALYGFGHPYFGDYSKEKPKSPEEILKIGYELGAKEPQCQ